MKRRLILGAAAAMLSILGAATAYAAVEGINGGPGVMMEENMAEQSADTMKENITEKLMDKNSQTPEQKALAAQHHFQIWKNLTRKCLWEVHLNYRREQNVWRQKQ